MLWAASARLRSVLAIADQVLELCTVGAVRNLYGPVYPRPARTATALEWLIRPHVVDAELDNFCSCRDCLARLAHAERPDVRRRARGELSRQRRCRAARTFAIPRERPELPRLPPLPMKVATIPPSENLPALPQRLDALQLKD